MKIVLKNIKYKLLKFLYYFLVMNKLIIAYYLFNIRYKKTN